MFADCLLGSAEWYSSRCALTWKMQGTTFNRLLFRLAPSERRTAGTGYGLLLPTVQTRLKLLPTPNATDGERGGMTVEAKRKMSARSGILLVDLVKSDFGTSQLNPLFVAEMMGFPDNWLVLPFQDGDGKA
jgi:hypothetical protein